jgi:hypothetical protein
MRTGLIGYVCACAVAASAESVVNSSTRTGCKPVFVFIVVLLLRRGFAIK